MAKGGLDGLIGDIKSIPQTRLIEAIQNNPQESRRDPIDVVI